MKKFFGAARLFVGLLILAVFYVVALFGAWFTGSVSRLLPRGPVKPWIGSLWWGCNKAQFGVNFASTTSVSLEPADPNRDIIVVSPHPPFDLVQVIAWGVMGKLLHGESTIVVGKKSYPAFFRIPLAKVGLTILVDQDGGPEAIEALCAQLRESVSYHSRHGRSRLAVQFYGDSNRPNMNDRYESSQWKLMQIGREDLAEAFGNSCHPRPNGVRNVVIALQQMGRQVDVHYVQLTSSAPVRTFKLSDFIGATFEITGHRIARDQVARWVADKSVMTEDLNALWIRYNRDQDRAQGYRA